MKQATMLYKHGGEHKIHGSNFDYVIVDAAIDGEIERHLEDGWHMTTHEAKEAAGELDDNDPITRSELEAKATELDIKFDGRTSDKKLLILINQKLGE